MGVIRKFRLFKYFVSALVVGFLFVFAGVYELMTVEGEGRAPKLVLMRLEDIGPGGQYGSLEQLGKLRAVLHYLDEEKVAYHLAVIPRWIDVAPDGTRYDVPLDRPDDPYTQAFRTLLQEAAARGATLGMHGYTHQVGDVRREDGHQESGIGNEFNEPGEDSTLSAAFAMPRVEQGLAIFRNAGLKPQFWESPHYRSTPEQDALFRTYFGLNYQADVQTDRNAPAVHYTTGRNVGPGGSSLGAAYVPTPFDYIPYNKDEKIIVDRVGKSSHVPSFFYHAFLEFKYLVPVTDEDGVPVTTDGIPEYRYAAAGKSMLHKLVGGLRAKGYSFYSIQDYVPFTPAHAVPLQKNAALLLEDADGDGQRDLIWWSSAGGTITVQPGRFQGLRNDPQPSPAVFGQANYAKGAAAAVSGRDASGTCSMWTLHPSGRMTRYVSDGKRFTAQASWSVQAGAWEGLYAVPQPDGGMLLAGLTKDRMQLYGWKVHGSELKPLKPFRFRSELKGELQVRRQAEGSRLFIAREDAVGGYAVMPDNDGRWKITREELAVPDERGFLRFGDFNGDGREDVLRWNPEAMTYTVYLQDAAGEWKLLSTLGPWGRPKENAQLLVKDMDGNGKADLVLVNRTDGYADLALSYERNVTPAP